MTAELGRIRPLEGHGAPPRTIGLTLGRLDSASSGLPPCGSLIEATGLVQQRFIPGQHQVPSATEDGALSSHLGTGAPCPRWQKRTRPSIERPSYVEPPVGLSRTGSCSKSPRCFLSDISGWSLSLDRRAPPRAALTCNRATRSRRLLADVVNSSFANAGSGARWRAASRTGPPCATSWIATALRGESPLTSLSLIPRAREGRGGCWPSSRATRVPPLYPLTRAHEGSADPAPFGQPSDPQSDRPAGAACWPSGCGAAAAPALVRSGGAGRTARYGVFADAWHNVAASFFA